jgi:hypothetical protein
MKIKFLMLALTICTCAFAHSTLPTIDPTSKQEIVNLTYTQHQYKAAVAAFYNVPTTAVILGASISENGISGHLYTVPSLPASGKVYGTATGFVVEDEVNGF